MLSKNTPNSKSKTLLFLNLFFDPDNLSKKLYKECVQSFGAGIIKEAVTKKHSNNHVKVIRWFSVRNASSHANQHADEKIHDLSDKELMSVVVGQLHLRPRSLMKEATK